MSNFKILLTGATGYIGSSVLNQLLSSPNPIIRTSQITVLLRGPSSRAAPFAAAGLTTLPFTDLDDTPAITAAAAAHDLVIGTTLGYHTPSALAIIAGLQQRLAAGKPAAYIHTDGMSNLSDAAGCEHGFSDRHDDICAAMRSAQAARVYIQRTTSLAVIDAGVAAGVPTYTMMAPMVYGRGAGSRFGANVRSVMIPLLMRDALRTGRAAVVGEGLGLMPYVHVLDLAGLYEMMAARVLGGEEMASGERGIFFGMNGHYTWRQVAQGIADAGVELGVLGSREVVSLSLEEAAERWRNGDTYVTELGLANKGRAESRADWAEAWGWKPTRGHEDFVKHFKEDFELVLRDGKEYGSDYQMIASG